MQIGHLLNPAETLLFLLDIRNIATNLIRIKILIKTIHSSSISLLYGSKKTMQENCLVHYRKSGKQLTYLNPLRMTTKQYAMRNARFEYLFIANRQVCNYKHEKSGNDFLLERKGQSQISEHG